MTQFLKSGPCSECAPGSLPVPLITGLCKFHYWGSRRRATVKKSFRTKKLQAPDLRQWYLDGIDQCPDWRCQNCSTPIPIFNEAAMFAAQAHILPKSLFPSVATHPKNRLYLGHQWDCCNCHGRFDSSWMVAETMQVWGLAQFNFILFCQDIAPEELKNLPEIFLSIYQSIENEGSTKMDK